MSATTEKSLEQKFNERKEVNGLLPAVQMYWKQITADFLKTFDVESLLKITREIPIVGYGYTKERGFVAYMEKTESRTMIELAKDYNYLQHFFPSWHYESLFMDLIEKRCGKNQQMWEDIYNNANNFSDLKKKAEKAIADL